MRIPRSIGALALVALFTATACGSTSSSPSASSAASSGRPSASSSASSGQSSSSAPSSGSSAPATAAPSVATIAVPADQLVFPTKLLICSDIPYPPQEFFDDQGNPIGSDIEIGQEIARRLGLEPVIINSVFDTIIAAVNGGKCDIIISAQNITADRKKQVDMIPYFQAGQSFVVAKGNPDSIKTQQDLCGKAVGAETGTTEVEYLQGSGDYKGKGLSGLCTKAGKAAIDVKTFAKDSDALLALQGQQVSAYFADSPVAGYYVTQHPDAFELSGLTLGVAKEGISVSKDKTGVRDSVKRALNAMVADGTYLAILTKWGVQSGTIFQ
jgi:polar amino acid transport system substrate-binding protein